VCSHPVGFLLRRATALRRLCLGPTCCSSTCLSRLSGTPWRCSARPPVRCCHGAMAAGARRTYRYPGL